MQSQFDLTEYIRCLLMKGVTQLSIYKHRQKSRRALLKLNNDLLNDIGISKDDAKQEAEKPFWEGEAVTVDTKQYSRAKRFLAPKRAIAKF